MGLQTTHLPSKTVRRELSLERSLAPELRVARREVGDGVGRISDWACHLPGTGVQILQGLRTES